MKLIFYSNMKKIGKKNIEQQPEKSGLLKELKIYFTLFNVVTISLLVVGSMALFQVGSVMWNDVTVWGKDFSLIFFGSRAGESISLGIGLQIIHYYLIGTLLLFSAIVLLFQKRWNKKTKIWAKWIKICFHTCVREFFVLAIPWFIFLGEFGNALFLDCFKIFSMGVSMESI